MAFLYNSGQLYNIEENEYQNNWLSKTETTILLYFPDS